jgi:hypothetical protein
MHVHQGDTKQLTDTDLSIGQSTPINTRTSLKNPVYSSIQHNLLAETESILSDEHGWRPVSNSILDRQ